MYAGKVEICGVNTAQLPVLTERQKTELLLAARSGNAAARQQMIQGNLRLVLSVVQKFAGRGENLDDLFQVGCIGLIKAIDNFDPTLKVRIGFHPAAGLDDIAIQEHVVSVFLSLVKAHVRLCRPQPARARDIPGAKLPSILIVPGGEHV